MKVLVLVLVARMVLIVTDISKLRRNYMYSCQFALDVVSLLPTDLLYLHSAISYLSNYTFLSFPSVY